MIRVLAPETMQAKQPDVDMAALERDLREAVRGEVHVNDAYRAMYSTDASNYRHVPVAVVLPRDAADAQRAMRVCYKHKVPATPRGGGTSLTGASCNVAVIFDYSKYMNHVIEIDPAARRARVEPGVVLDDLRNAAKEFGLTFGPAPATHNRCNVGGMFGNNACGMPAQFSGRMEESVIAAEVLLYDGTRMHVGATSEREYQAILTEGGRKAQIYRQLREIYEQYAAQIRERFPDFPRSVSGYNLNDLAPERGFHVARALTGTEGTCVHALELTVELVPNPKHKGMALVGFDDIATAGDYVAKMNEYAPHALEGMDVTLFQHMHEKGKNPHEQEELFPKGSAWLVAEFGAETKDEAYAAAAHCIDGMRASIKEIKDAKATADEHAMGEVTKIREAGLGVNAKIPNEPEYYPGWEDAAVPADRLGDYLRDFQKKLQEYGYNASIYGHFGQGCVHCRIDFDLFMAEGIEKYRAFVTDMAHIVTAYGGSISGEHGDGQCRGELLPIMYGEQITHAFWLFKTAFDPDNGMNPGKVVKPYPLDANLRWGVDYEPPEPKTFMAMREDHGTFHYAANRCVGAGACRKHDEGTMCPSYMVSREEKYSTRGRARLLFEMLRGNPLEYGWKNDEVRDSLDYCLACKACKHECPVNVDMATYKAEFLYHYFEGRARPLHMYLFGYMFRWAKIASLAPGIANFFTQAPPFSTIAKRVASMAPQRRIPMFAPQTFRQWFARRTPPIRAGADRVVLWVDTWNEHFHPQTARAAVEVLESAGYEVLIPPKQVCCGRPLYDYGLLPQAKRQLEQIVGMLRPLIREGVPVVGLEPSCMSVFKDELQNMLHGDLDADRLTQQTYILETFLKKKAERDENYRPPLLERSAVVHEHCHKKSLLDPTAETHLFEEMHMGMKTLDSGCCGMAGAFGFEKSHYDMSVACGERVLLPAVRDANPETIVVADGFSCREQIMQTTKRRALHPAEVMKMALDDRGIRRDDAYPERRFMPDDEKRRQHIIVRGYAVLGAACALAAAGIAALARRRR
jgi:FAD/FMN-containing dehydrogenase/Fe-S oxidoreductase